MIRKAASVVLLLVLLAAPLVAGNDGEKDEDVPHLDHVFIVMMENHGYSQIIGNPNAPFANQYSNSANSTTNYFAVGHPSSTNYLEIVGGSNFGDRSDKAPDWHDSQCAPNLGPLPYTTTDFPSSPNVCPIAGVGKDAATPGIDYTNECPNPAVMDPCPPGLISIDGRSIPAANNIVGKSIGDQLVEHGLSWKSYQESLPATGADGISYSDGFFTNLSTIPDSLGGANAFVELYATKHNPFAYFKSVQEGLNPNNSLANVVGFEGKGGFYDDLSSGRIPSLSFIAPNQCNDQHGRGNGGAQCAFDPNDNGTQAGLNPALIYVGDLALRTIVRAIHNSPAWSEGNNVIVVVWDENDYSFVPNVNKVLLIVDTNYGPRGLKSGRFYTHFSLLKTLEKGFGLSCLNHACDPGVSAISDLFQSGGGPGNGQGNE